MCASLHKAQLLGGVKRQPPDRGTLGTAVLGASGFLGVGNLNLSCLCWVSNMAVTNDHSKSVLAMCTLLHLPQAARLCDRQVTDLCLSCFVGEMGEKGTGDMVHRTESHLQDPHNKQQKQTNTVPQGWRGRDRWMAGAYRPGV